MRRKHLPSLHGWAKQKAHCDYAMWWDCGFWCDNDEIFGKKPAHKRACPMMVPRHSACLMLKTGKSKKKLTPKERKITDMLKSVQFKDFVPTNGVVGKENKVTLHYSARRRLAKVILKGME